MTPEIRTVRAKSDKIEIYTEKFIVDSSPPCTVGRLPKEEAQK
jgi:hypothetical protein